MGYLWGQSFSQRDRLVVGQVACVPGAQVVKVSWLRPPSRRASGPCRLRGQRPSNGYWFDGKTW